MTSKPVGAATIGNFDGFHRGHQCLVSQVVQKGKGEGGSLLVTFEPHPREILNPQVRVPRLSSDWTQLCGHFEAAGLDEVLQLQTSREFLKLTATDFMEMLWEKRPFRHLVVGHDFALGANREGNAEFLKKWCDQKHIEFFQVEAFVVDGEVVSSQRIRSELLNGHVDKAATLLGQPYLVQGEVQRGEGRGKLLKFPTANILIEGKQLVPQAGVYAGWVWVKNKRHPAVVNLGKKPTFENSGEDSLLEIHILDFEKDIYGEILKFEFVHHLREVRKFPSLDSLVEQIGKDVLQARKALDQ
tara:strand:+ start:29583 stop:30482 length:900 start_codon:yes stop_codon:yes gene_type:complete